MEATQTAASRPLSGPPPQVKSSDLVCVQCGHDVSDGATVEACSHCGGRIRILRSMWNEDHKAAVNSAPQPSPAAAHDQAETPTVEQPPIATGTTLRFKDRAIPMALMGLPTIRLHPKSKIPIDHAWQELCTTNVDTILMWDRETPKAGCAVVAKPDGVLFLEIDQPGVQGRFEKETGQPWPQTYTVQSSPGKYHYYFKQTDRTRAIGNIAQSVLGFGSQRANNGYVVAPGSIHPDTGLLYTAVLNVPIIEYPDGLADWIVKQVKKEKEARPLSKDLDGPKIPYKSHDTELTRIAGLLHRENPDMTEDEAADRLIAICEARCENYGHDYREMCRKIAHSIWQTPAGVQPTVTIGGQVPGSAPSAASTTPAPEQAPAPAPINISIPYSDLIFHGLAGRIIRKLQPQTESHPVGNLLELLATFGNIIGPTAYYLIEDTKHFCNLFVVKVGRSSKSRKGTGSGRIARIASSLDLTWFTSRNTSGLGSGEVVVWEVRDPIIGTIKNKSTGETHQGVIDPGIDDKRLYVSEGEFAGILAVAGRKDSLLSKVIRDAWDHKPIRNKSKGSSAVCLNPHISMTADITREELHSQLKQADQFNGFSNRYLWCLVERQALLPHGGEDIDWTDEIVELHEAVKFAQSQKRVFMDRNARLMWERMYSELSEDIGGLIGAVTSRAEAQTIRLALIFAMLDRSDHIGVEHLKAARALWQYCEDSARIIFGGVTKLQQRILDFIQTGPKSLTDILVILLSKNRRKEEIKSDLTFLLSAGRIIAKSGDDGIQRFHLPGA